MKLKLRTASKNCWGLWHGVSIDTKRGWYDLGLLGVDISKDLIDIYFLWWNLEIWRGENARN